MSHYRKVVSQNYTHTQSAAIMAVLKNMTATMGNLSPAITEFSKGVALADQTALDADTLAQCVMSAKELGEAFEVASEKLKILRSELVKRAFLIEQGY